MSLSADQIRNAKPRLLCVPVPEWGGDVFIRPISGAQREQYADLITDREKSGPLKMAGLMGWSLVRSLCNETGALLWPVDKADDIMNQDGTVLDRLYDAALEHSGLKSTAIEDAEKNFEPTQAGDSGSA